MYSYFPGQSTMLPQVHSNLSGVSWDSAATECGQYGLENDQHILGNISDLVGKTFSIGEKVYHVTLPWMEILGRYLDTNLNMFRVVPVYLLCEGELSSRMYEGAWLSWTYAMWIYYYLCNQYLSLLPL